MALPLPIPVELKLHDPRWVTLAHIESQRIITAMGSTIVEVHHIGSTSIPTIRAKPIIDLIPVASSHAELGTKKNILERLGYQCWWEEDELPGRRYCTFDDELSKRRVFQLHCYENGSTEIARHLAFRDHLRKHAEIAKEYEVEKTRCAKAHPDNSQAYTDCKSAWIKRIEADALSAMAGRV